MPHDEKRNPEEKWASLFQTDPIIYSQYWESLKRKTHLEAEKKLMRSVLEDAVHCFQSYYFSRSRKRRSLFRETEEWLFGKGETDWPFSYSNICEVLGIDPDYLRRGLKSWEAKITDPAHAAGRSPPPANRCKRKIYRKSA